MIAGMMNLKRRPYTTYILHTFRDHQVKAKNAYAATHNYSVPHYRLKAQASRSKEVRCI